MGQGDLKGWSQCVGLDGRPDGAALARFTWNWPTLRRKVKAYPEIIYGYKPGRHSTTVALPKIVDELNELSVQYDFSSNHSGVGNTAFDIWLTDTAVPKAIKAPPVTHEIMIWLETFGDMGSDGTFRETEIIDGAPFNVYVNEKNKHGWRYIRFGRVSNHSGASTLDLRAFLLYAKSKKYITGSEYVASVEFGNEIVSGSGEMNLSRFKVTVR
jgi:hypothetical protein